MGEGRTCRKFRPMMNLTPRPFCSRASICSVDVRNVSTRSSLLPPVQHWNFRQRCIGSNCATRQAPIAELLHAQTALIAMLLHA